MTARDPRRLAAILIANRPELAAHLDAQLEQMRAPRPHVDPHHRRQTRRSTR